MNDALYAEQRQHAFLGYGRNDYILGRPFSAENLVTWEGVTKEQGKAWYTEGWNSAKQEEQEKGRVLFLLDELLSWLQSGDEWYGTDFDIPTAIAEKIKECINKPVEPM